MRFEIRCKKSKHRVFGINPEIWNTYFAGHTFVFDTNNLACVVDIDFHFQYYLPTLHEFEVGLLPKHERKTMEYWLIYPQYKRRIQ